MYAWLIIMSIASGEAQAQQSKAPQTKARQSKEKQTGERSEAISETISETIQDSAARTGNVIESAVRGPVVRVLPNGFFEVTITRADDTRITQVMSADEFSRFEADMGAAQHE